MFYNKALYKKAGVAEPSERTTWEQYLRDAPSWTRTSTATARRTPGRSGRTSPRIR
ncbi:hypothetical protein NKH18_13505 [Streptomyces sp. M10(2022)]